MRILMSTQNIDSMEKLQKIRHFMRKPAFAFGKQRRNYFDEYSKPVYVAINQAVARFKLTNQY